MGSKKPERSAAKKPVAAAPKKAPPPAPEKPKAKTSSKATKAAPPPAAAKNADRDRDDLDSDDDEPSSSLRGAASKGANGKARDQLVALGKSKGFLTYDDVHEALPGEDVGPDQMDDVLSALDDEEIEVVDDASNIKVAPHRGSEEEPPTSKASPKSEEEPQLYTVAPVVTTSSTSNRCLPSILSALVSPNRPSIFCQRSTRFLRVWLSVGELRITTSFKTGFCNTSVMPSQRSADWL